jgi:hypothetical protein
MLTGEPRPGVERWECIHCPWSALITWEPFTLTKTMPGDLKTAHAAQRQP